VFGPGALENTRAAGRPRRGRRWGHLRFDRDAKKVLELSLREAIRAGSRSLGTEHVLLGMLHTDTGAAQPLLAARGVTLDEVRAAVEGRGRASG
jgi:ATP-dependent Clp protease ATP-binding subunit ClpA